MGTMNKGQVIPAFVDGGTWSASFGLSWTSLMLHDQAMSQRIIRTGGQYLRKRAGTMGVAAGRNEIAARFLDTNAEWLFMVDTDMGFEPDTVDRLVATAEVHGVHAVGALAFAQSALKAPEGPLYTRRTRIIPTLYRYVELADEKGFLPIEPYERDAVQAVDGTGAACMLVHREALTALGPDPFAPIRVAGGLPDGRAREFSEDLSFCARLANIEVPIVVDTSIKTSHHKGGLDLDESAYLAQQAVRMSSPLGVREPVA